MRDGLKRLLIAAFLVFLLVWVVSLLKCELLTYRYGNQFEELYREHSMIGDIDYLKVLTCTNDRARVYYVSKNRSSGNILEFYKDNDKWRQDRWDTVWSASGSADGSLWPYIR